MVMFVSMNELLNNCFYVNKTRI